MSDSGIGIEPAMLPRGFVACAQEEASITRQFGGLGLGPASSKAFAGLHGETIEVHQRRSGQADQVSDPTGAGEVGAAHRADWSHSEAPRARSPKLRILLVDDHGDTIDMLKAILEREGHVVRIAGDAASALEAAAQGEFDLLLSDLGLPDRSGLDLMRRLRARGWKQPGVALSVYGQESDIEQGWAAGVSEHLVKAADPDVLSRTIENPVQSANT